MTPKTDDPERRRRVGEALKLWGGLTLSGVVVLSALGIWHLRRRGWMVRERLGPPREIDWPDEAGRGNA